MAFTAAHLVENVIPCIPIRQWVISFPQRIRHYLLEYGILQDVLNLVVDEIRKTIIACSPDAPNAQIGAVSFIQKFGSTLNVHPHFHLVVSDGAFYQENGGLRLSEAFLSQDDILATQRGIQERVLHFFEKRGWFTRDAVEKMLLYENSGFSLDASVRIDPWDRQGLERLIRYCARPPFASENLRWNGKWLVYRLSKPNYKGQVSVQLDPLEFLGKIAAFIPLPHRHRHHYHGVFAPNAPLRKAVAASAQRSPELKVPLHVHRGIEKTKRVSLDWAALIARIYEVNPLICTSCGGKIKIIGFVVHAAEIHRILRGLGWSIKTHEFDPPYDLRCDNISQLVPGSDDGFPVEVQVHCAVAPDPPFQEGYSDPPHWADHADPPHDSD
jgi:hypothetical protein